MKQTKSHQCKCHLKSESAIINSTATKCSVVSYISSCFVRMTANALITIACRDLLINKSQLLSWQSAEHKALLAVGKPQQMLCVHHASITRSLSAHPWRSTWPHSCATHVWLKFHSCTGVVVPGVSFWVVYVPCRGGHDEARGAGGQALLGLQPSHQGLAGSFWVTCQRTQLCLLMRRLKKPWFVNISYLIIKASNVLHSVQNTQLNLIRVKYFLQ